MCVNIYSVLGQRPAVAERSTWQVDDDTYMGLYMRYITSLTFIVSRPPTTMIFVTAALSFLPLALAAATPSATAESSVPSGYVPLDPAPGQGQHIRGPHRS
jgi:hypothetical protein